MIERSTLFIYLNVSWFELVNPQDAAESKTNLLHRQRALNERVFPYAKQRCLGTYIIVPRWQDEKAPELMLCRMTW